MKSESAVKISKDAWIAPILYSAGKFTKKDIKYLSDTIQNTLKKTNIGTHSMQLGTKELYPYNQKYIYLNKCLTQPRNFFFGFVNKTSWENKSDGQIDLFFFPFLFL